MAEDQKPAGSLLDDAAKAAASGVSRREVLKRLGVGIAGALLASAGLQDRALAGHGSTTGTTGCPAGYTKCKGGCVQLSSNAGNCGACGHVCS
ncbi:MAG: twin-arginine translocation signal domain-containing protein, partial [Chloroflexi bacterium]|nr:twin-arginine translocation signal domain-containing protein [Chloroflexota bacterium]